MKLIKSLLLLSILGFGILVGFFFRNFPLIEWNKEIKIYETFQVISTLFIAIAVPFFIKKWIDDGRMIKNLLSEEIKDIYAEIKKINEKFVTCYEADSISAKDKNFIILLFNLLENQIDVLKESLNNSFGNKYDNEFHDLKIAYFEYENKITGGDLMSEGFTKISIDFFELQAQEYRNLLTALRRFSINVQKK